MISLYMYMHIQAEKTSVPSRFFGRKKEGSNTPFTVSEETVSTANSKGEMSKETAGIEKNWLSCSYTLYPLQSANKAQTESAIRNMKEVDYVTT